MDNRVVGILGGGQVSKPPDVPCKSPLHILVPPLATCTLIPLYIFYSILTVVLLYSFVVALPAQLIVSALFREQKMFGGVEL
jgi:hypothetical protein